MYKAFLIKYAEIAIKGKNRYIFEDALVAQIKYQAASALQKNQGVFLYLPMMNLIMKKLWRH